jgi:protein-L-isoaspartate O-methyltransferase
MGYALVCVLALSSAGLLVLAQDAGPKTDKLAPYVPTPQTVVKKMLQLGQLKPGEKMFDLGSGDGRIVIMAAKEFKAEAVGVEFDPHLVARSTAAVHKAKLDKTAKIVLGDIFEQDYSSADLITVYLLPESNKKVGPMLEKQLHKGSRVVAHDFGFPGWEPVREEVIEDDGTGRSHTLFLYVR